MYRSDLSGRRGTSEGERVDQRSENFAAGVTMDRAAAYRLKNGYVEAQRDARDRDVPGLSLSPRDPEGGVKSRHTTV